MKNRYIFKEDKNLFSMKFLFHIANLLLTLTINMSESHQQLKQKITDITT